MNDTYSKVMLTIIAAALCVNAFQNLNMVKPAFALDNQIYRIAICNVDGLNCAGISRGAMNRYGEGKLMIDN